MNRAVLRRGDIITRERIRNYSLICLAVAIFSIATLILRAHGANSPDGQPLGADFSDIYTAGLLADSHHAADAYDWNIHHAIQQTVFGPNTPFYAWSYPPVFFLIAGLCALAPYLLALAFWQVGSLVLYLAAMRRIVGDIPGWLLPTLAFPGVFINICNGHNGLLSAFLFGLGLQQLEKHPWRGGALLGVLCYKPHFGLLLPLALLAARQWRALLAAAASVLTLSILATLLFGESIWPAFFASLGPTRTVLLEDGSTGFSKMQSLFAAARNWGASVTLAYILHGLLALAVIAATLRLWHGPAPHARKAAALITGSLLVTPYLIDYDLTMLAPALAFLAAHGLRTGFAPYEKILLVGVWITPLIARTLMQATTIPLGFLSLLLLFLFCISAGHNNACRELAGAVKE